MNAPPAEQPSNSFIGFEFAESDRHTLLAMLPAQAHAQRQVLPEQFHLTLLNLGPQPTEILDRVASDLAGVEPSAVPLKIKSVDCFEGQDHRRFVVASVKLTVELAELQQKILTAVLKHIPLPASRHRFNPHITLSVLKPGLPDATIQAYLTDKTSQRHVLDSAVLCLFCTAWVNDVPTYVKRPFGVAK